MRITADEGVDRQVVDRLRHDGHDVRYVAEEAAGTSDAEILRRADEEDRLLLTADKDFGELIFRRGSSSAGVLLLRLAGLSPPRKAAFVATAVQEHESELRGRFTVIRPGSIRIRARLDE